MYDMQFENETKKQISQQNFELNKNRQEEKKKVQQAILLSKIEEAK